MRQVLPRSILDTDLYKLTMQQAVLYHFPDAVATYRFNHRDKEILFTRACADLLQSTISQFSELSLTASELEWLKESCPYFKPSYFDYLRQYRFKPEQIRVEFLPSSEDGERGDLFIEATGPWVETIFWEVPVMACLSEIYFSTVETDWSYDGQEEIAYKKGKDLLEAGCFFSEFGTRRRRSYHIQDLVVKTLIRAGKDTARKGAMTGTSNVHLAHKYDVKPSGTIAHEWFMGVGAMKGYENANMLALDLWEEVYPNALLIALTDTFTTRAFFSSFQLDPERARRWFGLRQDSGDPYDFAPLAKEVYAKIGVDHTQKTIIYSDALNLDKAIGLKKQCDEVGFKVAFGIGTFLTNDFMTVSSNGAVKSKALNMVIKISSIDGKPCVKISDDLHKNTGDEETILRVKRVFNLP